MDMDKYISLLAWLATTIRTFQSLLISFSPDTFAVEMVMHFRAYKVQPCRLLVPAHELELIIIPSQRERLTAESPKHDLLWSIYCEAAMHFITGKGLGCA